MSNFLKDISKIYNEYYTGDSSDRGNLNNVKYTAVTDRKNSAYPYFSQRVEDPKIGIDAQAAGSIISPEDEEEKPLKGNVSREKLSEFIDTELQKAAMFGMDYCVMVLTMLKKEFKC